MSLPERKADVVVIGGGAAGMMAAGTAAGRGLSVTVLDLNRDPGRKLRITGKGRCNVTNACTPQEFLRQVVTNPKFLHSSLAAFPPAETMAFFETLGVPLKTERGSRVFPVSDSAHDIADALVRWQERGKVVRLRSRARRLVTEGGAVTAVETDSGILPCRAAILCTGGASYPLTGSDGTAWAMAEALGHTVIPPQPSLIPLESPDAFCEELAGFAPKNVVLTAYEDDKPVFHELGEMLFTHFGVSGPLVLSASTRMRRFADCRYRLTVDFKPALSEQQLDERILRDFAEFSNREFQNALGKLEARSLIPVLVRLSGIPGQTKVNSVTRAQRRTLVQLLKAFPIAVSGTRPLDEAIVTAGGVDVRQVDPRTMQSRLVRGLYFAGETLNVDALTGGYNLQIAWSTGRCAGRSVLS